MHRQQWESWALCSSLPSRVGTSLLRAKQGAAPAMGLIPLVCKGGGLEWRRCTIYNSMEHSKAAAAGKGDSSRGKARQWSCSGRNKSVWRPEQNFSWGVLQLRKYFYQCFGPFTYLREQLIFSREVDIRPTFVFFPLSRSFGRLLENSLLHNETFKGSMC